MTVIEMLLGYVKDKGQIENAVTGINLQVIGTYKQCFKTCFENAEKVTSDFKLRIDSVCDYLHEELHTGHWCDVPISTREGFTAASFLKALIILAIGNTDSPALSEAVKCLDLGILLGAPLDQNPDLLMKSAKCVSEELARLKDSILTASQEGVTARVTPKRKKGEKYREYNDLKAIPIEQKPVPSLEHFLKFHLMPEKPVVIQDCMGHWPACKKWPDVSYLLKVAGERTVPIEVGSQYSDENWSQKLMTFREFIEKYYLEKNQDIGYLAQHNLLDQIPELKDDICMPEYCCLSRDFSESKSDSSMEINAWFGPKGTVSSLHYDPKDNILAQVFGTKQILMFPPADSDRLYPHDSPLLVNTAQVDPTVPDLVAYPLFKEATMYKCLLCAGDMLYIPPKWWHHVTALEKSFSVNFWWT